MLHQPLIRLQPIPGARKVPVGGLHGRQRREGRRAGRTRVRTLHGCRLQDDHDRRRVSVNILLIFRISSLHPLRAKYPWVGCLQEDTKVEGEAEARTPHANSLFMAADNTMITIGGGYVNECCVAPTYNQYLGALVCSSPVCCS